MNTMNILGLTGSEIHSILQSNLKSAQDSNPFKVEVFNFSSWSEIYHTCMLPHI